MVVLTIAIILIVVIHAVLLPRVHVRIDAAKDHAEFELHSVWFSIKGRTGQASPSGRFLFFSFPKTKKDRPASFKAKSKSAPATEKADASEEIDDKASTKKPLRAKEKKKAKKTKKKPEKKSGDSDSAGTTFAQFWEAKELVFEVLKRIISGVVRFFKSIRTDYLDLRLEVGLEDAMQTGILIGILHPLFFLQGKRRQVVIVPHFDEYAFDFSFACSFSLRPIQVVNVFIIEAFKFPWRRSWLFVYRTWIKKSKSEKAEPMEKEVAAEVHP